ncbi:peptidase S24-like protein [mine drainage metagenome]|uniref:Peptidase S24-like protein n=1 Tax=mine drainage metagenome TaxID=410659 RepID=A0A1J5TB15_9ZZZZ
MTISVKPIMILLAALAGFAARADAHDAYMMGMYVGRCPEPSHASFQEAWNRAESAAAAERNAFVVVGSGPSMEPLYPSGTVLVVKQVPYSSLKSGSAVVYVNHEGKPVLHVLVALTSDGWRVAGLNNPGADPGGVDAGNFAGLVVSAFIPDGPNPLAHVERIAMR